LDDDDRVPQKRKGPLVARADEVIESSRSAAIDSGEVTLWVMNRRATSAQAGQKYPQKPPRLRVADRHFEA
jgi:hypothetical protein